jgi:hypothetical protein
LCPPTSPSRRPVPRSRRCRRFARSSSTLEEAIDAVGKEAPPSNSIPRNARTVSVDQWREYAYRRQISDGNQNAKRMAFNRAVAQLQAGGHIGCLNDIIWIAAKG